jgi:hypothetical protein
MKNVSSARRATPSKYPLPILASKVIFNKVRYLFSHIFGYYKALRSNTITNARKLLYITTKTYNEWLVFYFY